jgi:hypothetical protein
MDKPTRQNARILIADLLRIEHHEVEAQRFEPSRTAIPIYKINDVFWCAPLGGAKPPRAWEWEPAGRIRDRPIFRSTVVIDPRFQ